MEMLEKVEKIREKTGVSYEDAKKALEASDGDILDAIVMLENQGKISKPATQVYTTSEDKSSEEFQEASRADQAKTEKKKGTVKSFLDWCGKMIKKSCENFFVVSKGDERIITVPVLVLVLLFVFAFWIILPLMIAGLFLGVRYSFIGEITKAVDVNTACDMAAEVAENVKNEFTRKDN